MFNPIPAVDALTFTWVLEISNYRMFVCMYANAGGVAAVGVAGDPPDAERLPGRDDHQKRQLHRG